MTDSPEKLVMWVLRHAKAASHGPKGDVSRPLTGKGRRQAASVREHLETLGLASGEKDVPRLGDRQSLPSLVLCSPATRARETAEIVMPALPEAQLQFEDVLYDEDADGVVQWLRLLDPVDSNLMIVGHNPTLYEICLILSDPADHGELESMGLPTAGLVRIDNPIPPNGSNGSFGSLSSTGWRGLTNGVGRVGHRFLPRL